MHKYFAKTQFLGKKVISLSQCQSTNDEADKYATEHPRFSEGVTIITHDQTNGRGQQGNKWLSSEGQNATFSFLLKPHFIDISQSFDLNVVISVGINRALKPILGKKLSIKWPNDIYYEDQKIGGVLIENTIKEKKIESSVVGIGINVNQSDFEIDNASSLKLLTQQSFEPNEIIEEVLVHTEEVYAYAKARGINELKAEYTNELYRLGDSSVFEDASGIFEGQITGINQVGQLLISRIDGEKTYNFKEVKFII